MANTIGWGQAAVNNTIDWGKGKTNNTIGWGTIYSSSPYGDTDLIGTPAGDADALAFIAAAAITNPTQKSAIDKLVTDLKGYGIWSKMKAIYPFCGGSAAQHKFNLRNPVDSDSAFRLVFNGGWTHSSTGALPNGTNAYADTKISPNLVQSINSNGLGCYITQNSSGMSDPVVMGCTDYVNFSFIQLLSSSIRVALNSTILSTPITGGAGFFSGQKTASTITKIYKNSTLLTTGNSGGGLAISSNIFLGTMGVTSLPYAQGYVNSQFRLAYISDGLTDTESANYYTAVQAFQTTLGRNV
jgi:hypothetical protein